MKMKRRNFLGYALGSIGGLLGFGFFNDKAVVASEIMKQKSKHKTTKKDIVEGNIFLSDECMFPLVILRCNRPIYTKENSSDEQLERYSQSLKPYRNDLYMFGGCLANPFLPWGDGGVITTGNDYMLRERGIDPTIMHDRYKYGITGYTKAEMIKKLNYENFELVGKFKYEWPDSIHKKLHDNKHHGYWMGTE